MPSSTSIFVFLSLLQAAPAASETVCVTGAGGYVATELVKQLLENGYNVKGTVRSLESKDKFEHLRLLDAALPGTLELLEADLLEPGSFDACAEGSRYVFHTASPFHFNAEDSLKDMIEPARNGTENVMMSAIKAKAERVIVTSSFAASNSFLPDDKPKSGKLYTEADWNEFTDEAVWKDSRQQAYMASKSLAEKRAWELGFKHAVKVIVIQPTFVLGPVYSRRVEGVSVATMKSVIEGTPLAMTFPVCDSRDVAKAHILAATSKSANGRYIVSHPATVPPSYFHMTLSEAFPQYEWVKPTDETQQMKLMLNNTKIRKLLGGLILLPDTINDMARSLISAKLATPKPARSEEL